MLDEMSIADDVVELIPVVLLDVEGPDVPERPSSRDEASWSKWRQRYWAAIGVQAHDVPDGMHVAVRALRSDRLLDAVMDYADACASESGQLAPYCDGGVVLRHNGQVMLSPDCCDLEEGLAEWVTMVRSRPKEPMPVHNGHRSGMARVIDDVIELELEQVSATEDGVGPFVTIQLGLQPVAAAVDAALGERAAFTARLERHLRQRGRPDAAVAAARITGVG